MPTVSENWAGQPLVDIETVVNLISNTTTRTGLKVRCDIDNTMGAFCGALQNHLPVVAQSGSQTQTSSQAMSLSA